MPICKFLWAPNRNKSQKFVRSPPPLTSPPSKKWRWKNWQKILAQWGGGGGGVGLEMSSQTIQKSSKYTISVCISYNLYEKEKQLETR